jgi:hypothetical protein
MLKAHDKTCSNGNNFALLLPQERLGAFVDHKIHFRLQSPFWVVLFSVSASSLSKIVRLSLVLAAILFLPRFEQSKERCKHHLFYFVYY